MKEGGRNSALQTRSNPIPHNKSGKGEFVLTTLPPMSCPEGLHTCLVAGGGMLNDGLAAEEVEGEGAEEGWDAVLAQQVELNQLPDGSGELRFQELHFSTGGAGGLRREKNKAINAAGSHLPSSAAAGAGGIATKPPSARLCL